MIDENTVQKTAHSELASGRWFTLSLFEQLGNIGSEISRATRREEKKDRIYENAITRAFELLDLTLADPRWHHRLKELVRVREVLADTIFGGHLYDTHLSDLDRYFFHFAVAARSSISTEKNLDPSSHL
ncbi:MAG: hypothetical protein AAB035_00535 [Nitrospirota bacterium]